jgi:hypothetical protein
VTAIALRIIQCLRNIMCNNHIYYSWDCSWKKKHTNPYHVHNIYIESSLLTSTSIKHIIQDMIFGILIDSQNLKYQMFWVCSL